MRSIFRIQLQNNLSMRKTKKLTVSIGIPALNEEANIKRLLESLKKQKYINCVLKEIVIVDDGSVDQTVTEVKKVKGVNLVLVRHSKRLGIVKSQNDIVTKVSGDILVMLDADVVPENDHFIEEIIKPIRLKKAALVGAAVASLEGITFIERALSYSAAFKTALYEGIKNQDNIYLCQGRARAMSKKLYTELRWVENVPEDAYSYLYARQKGFVFVYVPSAVVFFKSPTSIAEHARQRLRFLDSKNVLSAKFPNEVLINEYKVPVVLALKKFLAFFLRNPFRMMTYVFVTIYTGYFLPKTKIDHSKHQVAESSKRLSV